MKRFSLDTFLGLLALLTFAATRLIGLAQYPIFFFTDEAANTVLAAEFLDNGFRDQFGQLFPTYFQNGPSISLSTSVYAQLAPYLLFGKSIFVTRAVPAVIALTGALAVGSILKHIFKSRWWWISILLLSLTPAWFLHSRTAFEHTVWVSFFAWFLYFYLRYRTDQPRHLITAVVFAALSFYSYNGGQLGVVLMVLLLLIVDWRYHLRQRRVVLIAFGAAIICALPYARFQITHGAEVSEHLQLLGSYWMTDLPLGEKLSRAVQEYAFGLRPDYWFAPDNPRDLIRHQLKGYGNLLWVTLPFTVLGLIIAMKNVFRRSTLTPDTAGTAPAPAASPQGGEGNSAPVYRVALLALLIAPIGGVLVQANVLRDLIMIVPATLLATIGLAAALEWIVRHSPQAYRVIAILTCAVLIAANFMLLDDALTNGPTWYENYGLTGLQYGAPQVFTAIGDTLGREPHTDVWMFPSWLNGSEMLLRYFLPNDPRVHLLNFDGFLAGKFDLTDQTLLVMDDANYQRLIESGKFVETQIEQTIVLPNGAPGYHLLRTRYSPDIDRLLQQEQQALAQAEIVVDGETLQISHTPLQSGVIENLFDADSMTAVSSDNAAPTIIDITLPAAWPVTGLILSSDSRDLQLAIDVYADRVAQSGRYESTFAQLRPDQPIKVEFDPPPGPINRIRITLRDPGSAGALTLRDIAVVY
jgi:4-amino-4-deoxy-L-arabinose transferase-like glycosyltransferase